MPTGKVKWFNQTKGYGFIQPDQGGKDVFVHISSVQASCLKTLQEGAAVTYDLATGRNGKEQAANIALADLAG